MRINLKIKLIFMFFIFISLPLSGLGVFAYMSTSNSMQVMAQQSAKSLVAKTAEEINLSLDSVNKLVQVISGNETLANAAIGNINKKNEAFKYLSKLQKENGNLVESLIVTDASAKGIVSNGNENLSEDLSDRDYVMTALKGTAVQSEVVISKVSGKPVIAIAYPLLLDNKVVGTVIGAITFENITKYVATLKVGKEGYGYMIDKTGLVVCHPVNSKVFKENTSNTDNAELKNIVEIMKSGKTGEGFYTYEGVYKYVGFAPASNWVVAVTANYTDYMSDAIKIRNYTIIVIILAVILAMFLAYIFTTRNIINPIKCLEKLMIKAGDGDLTVKAHIATKDEIQTLGEYFNKMMEHQSNIINHVRSGASELACASENISASAQEINASTEEITSSIEEVASSAEHQRNSIVETSEVLVQLSSLIQIAQSKALTAKMNSRHTMDAAQQGRTYVKGAVEAIENINNVSNETGNTLYELSELSKKVNGIIDTINGISAQTNLLALNAAIEAARAGEHGKGFTIVAGEVRKLSEQTNTGANEISSLIKEMIIQIDKAVKSMNTSKYAVQNGVAVAKEMDESFKSIINAVDQITKDIEQISEVTKDEVANSDQIVKIIDSVATITETTTANSREVAAAAEEQTSAVESLAASSEQTSSMANSLYELVKKFNI